MIGDLRADVAAMCGREEVRRGKGCGGGRSLRGHAQRRRDQLHLQQVFVLLFQTINAKPSLQQPVRRICILTTRSRFLWCIEEDLERDKRALYSAVNKCKNRRYLRLSLRNTNFRNKNAINQTIFLADSFSIKHF